MSREMVAASQWNRDCFFLLSHVVVYGALIRLLDFSGIQKIKSSERVFSKDVVW